MNRANKVIGSILFTAFIIAVLVWTGVLTFSLVSRIMPGQGFTPWFALALFDGGALTWLFVLRGLARGAWQRGISMLMLGIDLVGVVIMAGGEIMMGQTFTDPGDLGVYLVYALVLWTLMNVIAIYGFHATDPEAIKEAEIRDVQDEIIEQSLMKLRLNMGAISARVAGTMALNETKNALRQLLPTGTASEIIDAYARPVDDDPTLPPPPARRDTDKAPAAGNADTKTVEPVKLVVPVPPTKNGNGHPNGSGLPGA